MESEIDVRKMFFGSAFYTGKLKEFNKQILGISILYRCIKHGTFVAFLLYDFKNLYLCQQSFSELQKLNQELNPSLEFNDIPTLINFLIENVMVGGNELSILQENNNFIYEILVDIIKVKWIFQCKKLDPILNEHVSQDLFVKPMINLLLAFQNFISTSDKKISSNKNEINMNDISDSLASLPIDKHKNFNTNLIYLIQESTKNTTKLNKEDKNNLEKKNFKIKNSDMDLSENKHLKRKKDTSLDRDKSSERTVSELDEDKQRKSKKKAKLKFV